jgi:hypothetical protein
MWLRLPGTCPCSPARAPSGRRSSWAGGPSATSSGTRTASVCSASGSRTACSLTPRSGATSEPLTPCRGVGGWMCFPPASRASLLPLLGGVAGLEIPATPGPAPSRSFATWSPESCSWRTVQRSLFEATSDASSLTWPHSGSWAAGVACERSTLERPTCDAEHGLPHGLRALTSKARLPTPTRADARGSRNATANQGKGSTGNDGQTLSDIAWAASGGTQSTPRPSFVEWLQGMPTGATDLRPLAMAGCLPWLRAHSSSSQGGPDGT